MTDYPCQWVANSTVPGDKSGVATFKVEGVTYVFTLNDSDDFHGIALALGEAFKSGLRQGKAIAAARMRREANELDPQP